MYANIYIVETARK